MKFFNLHSVKRYIVSSVIAILCTLVLFGIVSVIFSFFPPKEWILLAFGRYSTYLTVLIAAFLSARLSDSSGLVAGVFSAVFCLAILLISGSIFLKSGSFFSRFIRLLPLSSLVGAVGGVLGINSK